MKKTLILFSFLFTISCGKQTESFKMPAFYFMYIDTNNDYVVKYSGEDTLYLTDKIRKKNFYSLLDNRQGTELSKIIVEIEKPEYFSSEEYGNVNNLYFKFGILHENQRSKSFPFRKDAEKEMFRAAAKVHGIKLGLKFVETDKEYMFTQMKD